MLSLNKHLSYPSASFSRRVCLQMFSRLDPDFAKELFKLTQRFSCVCDMAPRRYFFNHLWFYDILLNFSKGETYIADSLLYVEQHGSLLFLFLAIWLSVAVFPTLTVPFFPFWTKSNWSGGRGRTVLEDVLSFSFFFTPSYTCFTSSSNASLTFVESSAEVSMKSMSWSIAYWWPRFVSTIRRCFRSDLLPIMMTDKSGSACSFNSVIHLSRFWNDVTLAIS